MTSLPVGAASLVCKNLDDVVQSELTPLSHEHVENQPNDELKREFTLKV